MVLSEFHLYCFCRQETELAVKKSAFDSEALSASWPWENLFTSLWQFFLSVESLRGGVVKFWYPQTQNANEDPVSWRAIICFFLFFWDRLSCKGKHLASFSLITAYFCWKKWCMRLRFVKTCRKNKSTLSMYACNFSNGKKRFLCDWPRQR